MTKINKIVLERIKNNLYNIIMLFTNEGWKIKKQGTKNETLNILEELIINNPLQINKDSLEMIKQVQADILLDEFESAYKKVCEILEDKEVQYAIY